MGGFQGMGYFPGGSSSDWHIFQDGEKGSPRLLRGGIFKVAFSGVGRFWFRGCPRLMMICSCVGGAGVVYRDTMFVAPMRFLGWDYSGRWFVSVFGVRKFLVGFPV